MTRMSEIMSFLGIASALRLRVQVFTNLSKDDFELHAANRLLDYRRLKVSMFSP